MVPLLPFFTAVCPVQDDITIIADTFWITLGSKLEHNDYSVFEVQPSARAHYKPSERQTIWAAVSRAVRTPSRSEHDLQAFLGNSTTVITPPPTLVPVNAWLYGDDRFDSEELLAYELGYRWQASDDLSLDLATFCNDYDNLRTIEPATPIITPFPPAVTIPSYLANGREGSTYGLELQATWQATDALKLVAAYTLINSDLEYTEPLRQGDDISDEDLIIIEKVP